MKKSFRLGLCGSIAGAVNGLFGAGGGMVLVPLLTGYAHLPDDQVFSNSVAIILPVCCVSAAISLAGGSFDILQALPYLIGSILGGVLAGVWGRKIPSGWLHKVFGILIIWGGIRYLC